MQLEAMLILCQLAVLIFSLSVHEAAHAYAAFRLGDATAYMLGRVTLNPAKHIDPLGTLLMPLIALIAGFPLLGWAKPCPITLRNFRKVKRDDILTTFAGPGSNLVLATLALVLLIALKHTPGMGADAVLTAMGLTMHMPLDTEGLPRLFPLALVLYYGILTNVLLFCFNLVPIPPLDGSRIFRYALPLRWQAGYDRLGAYSLLLVFFFAGRLMMPVFRPLLSTFNHLLVSL